VGRKEEKSKDNRRIKVRNECKSTGVDQSMRRSKKKEVENKETRTV
jgi:hypothetical protein